jgi:hypothetical protein
VKVKQLIDILKACNSEDEVILAKDSEGNGFSPLASCEACIYVPETTWYGEIHLRELTPKLESCGYSEEDLYSGDKGTNAIVLWPIN